MKRIFDLFFGVILSSSLVLVLLFIAIAIRRTSKGSVLYWSDRVGKNNKIFKMPKFRSMLTDTPAVATHLLSQVTWKGASERVRAPSRPVLSLHDALSRSRVVWEEP